MDETCFVKPIHKRVTAEEYMHQRIALLAISDMGCPHCAGRVHNKLIALYGVTNVTVEHLTGRAEVTFNPNLVHFQALLEAVANADADGQHQYEARLMNSGY